MVIQAEDSIFTEYSVKASSIGSQSSKLLQLKSFGSHDEAKLAKSNLNPDNLQTKGMLKGAASMEPPAKQETIPKQDLVKNTSKGLSELLNDLKDDISVDDDFSDEESPEVQAQPKEPVEQRINKAVEEKFWSKPSQGTNNTLGVPSRVNSGFSALTKPGAISKVMSVD